MVLNQQVEVGAVFAERIEGGFAKLAARLAFDGAEAIALWSAQGIADAARVPDLDVAAVTALGAR